MTSIEPAFYVVDKPAGWTSHRVVACMRAMLGRPKTGHTGTLDPFATGVLVVAIGQATRLISFLPEHSKSYMATISLGKKTNTGDKDGDVVMESDTPRLDANLVEATLQGFLGKSLQKAPIFSALKKNGKPLYEYARKGIAVETPIREIEVDAIQLIDAGLNHITFKTSVSRGTYIRTLAEDIAESLGAVGHLSSLRRLSSGSFDIATAISMSDMSIAAAGSPNWEHVFDRDFRENYPWFKTDIIVENISSQRTTIGDAFGHLDSFSIQNDLVNRIRNGLIPHSLSAALPRKEQYLLTYQNKALALAAYDNNGHKLLRVISS